MNYYITGAPAKEREEIQNLDKDLLILSKPIDFDLLRRIISTTLDLRKPNGNQSR